MEERWNVDLRRFMVEMEGQVSILDIFDLSIEIQHGMMKVTHPDVDEFYVHTGRLETLGIASVGWFLSLAAKSSENVANWAMTPLYTLASVWDPEEQFTREIPGKEGF